MSNEPASVADSESGGTSGKRPPAHGSSPNSKREALVIDWQPFSLKGLTVALGSTSNNYKVTASSDLEGARLNAESISVPSLITICSDKQTSAGVFWEYPTVVTSPPTSILVILPRDMHSGNPLVETSEIAASGNLPAIVLVVSQRMDLSMGDDDVPEKFSPAECKPPDFRRSDCHLTPRQKEVLLSIREGNSNRAIASRLNLRESTVKVHVRNLMKRLNARNRTEASFKAQNVLEKGIQAITNSK